MNFLLKIDVLKIDKAKLFKGEKGTYLDAVLIMRDEPDQYENIGMIVQSVSKEERDRGVKGAILGNVKRLSTGSDKNPKPETKPDEGDGLPF